MPYEPVTWCLPPDPDGTIRSFSIVPRKDRAGADLQWWDLPKQLMDLQELLMGHPEQLVLTEEPCRLLELPLEVMTNILHQVSFSFARERACSSIKTDVVTGRSKRRQIFMPYFKQRLGFTTSSSPSGGSI